MNGQIRRALIGPRSVNVIVGAQPATSKDLAMPAQETRPLFVANSHLIVVKAFLNACGIEELADNFGSSVKFVEAPWSDDVITRCDRGEIDLCVFNRAATDDYMIKNPDHKFQILGDIGFSMGGRNFSALTRKGHPLVGRTVPEMKTQLKGMRIYVGTHTDRYRNLMISLGVSEEFWLENDVTIINVVDPALSIFQTDPDAIIVTGQNTRFEAHLSGNYSELVSFSGLPADVQAQLLHYATNSLIIGPSFLLRISLSPDDIFASLMGAFQKNWQEIKTRESLTDALVYDCDFGDNSFEDRGTIARHVLYETYRIGRPIW